MTWLSPAFPVGAFSYSHGLEWAVEQRSVRDAATLCGWMRDLLAHGAPRSDLILLAEAWRATAAGDTPRLDAVVELAAALVPSAERRLETIAQGNAFVTAAASVWPSPQLALLKGREVAYPVAVGAATAAHGLDLALTARAFAQAFVANVVSAGVRLVPLGQTDGLRAIAELEPDVAQVTAAALAAGLDDVGGAALAADIGSMLHETQYTRLFRS
ncbi:MAG: urease accessory protein UreF [Hyphomicrobiaceae bacterium]|nr:urease accessory protein UreF [Hyphomicrobiaceae bacterium]